MFVCFKNGLLEFDALDTYVLCVCVCCFSILFSLFFSDGVSEGSKRKKKKNFFTSVYLGKCIRKYIYIYYSIVKVYVFNIYIYIYTWNVVAPYADEYSTTRR